MSWNGGELRGFVTRILAAAGLVLPALALVLVVLHFASGDRKPSASAAAAPIQAKAVRSTKARPANAGEPARARARHRKPVKPPKPAKPKPEEKDPPAPEPPASPIVWTQPGKSAVVRDAPNGSLVHKQGPETEFGSPTVFSVQRETRRWLGVSTPLVANGELGWIRADPDTLGAGHVKLAIEVDLSERTSTLLRGDEVLRSWPVTVGGPASPTPTGTYAVTDTFRGGLNPVYGCCAVAISATQPNLPVDLAGREPDRFPRHRRTARRRRLQRLHPQLRRGRSGAGRNRPAGNAGDHSPVGPRSPRFE